MLLIVLPEVDVELRVVFLYETILLEAVVKITFMDHLDWILVRVLHPQNVDLLEHFCVVMNGIIILHDLFVES